ncbi:MAG: hypothetical protein KFB96_20175 [Thiocapsa sp.]|uniref:hypothetical protein n=1 Tax=Thiocapsa sp. TaxID=2024551 RepID=UPI001BCC6F36|nr:hypothetical protein [Thiocapsa sp.]QVL47949.1 MAG: hypothetical protein KFB96_20175 [Thiocapsa sp.]
MSKLDGTYFRELLPVDDPPRPANDCGDLKALLAGLTEGLTAEDLQRARDFGRGDPEWAS